MSGKLASRAASIAAAATMLLATTSHARHELPMIGGGGDAAAQAMCPAGQKLAGFAGRSGLWIDRIQPVCVEPGKDPVATGMYYGGAGGGESSGFCPRNWDMTRAAFWMTVQNKQVANASFECRSRATGETTDMSFGNPAYPSRCPNGFWVQDCPDYVNSQQCAADEIPLGFNVRYGKHVNAIGLVCGRPPDNQVTTGSPPAPLPVAPTKPIRIGHMAHGDNTPQTDPCISAREAKAKGMSPMLVATFEKQCRLRGGDPNAPDAPAPIDNGGGQNAGGAAGASAATDTTIYDKPAGNDVAYLTAGDPVTIVRCNSDNWCQISKPRRGWVWGEDLKR